MKGIGNAIWVVIILILALIFLWVLYSWTFNAKATGDTTLLSTALKQCCSDRSKWDCKDTSLNTTMCDVPGSNPMSLRDLSNKVHIDPTSQNLLDFCYCNT